MLLLLSMKKKINKLGIASTEEAVEQMWTKSWELVNTLSLQEKNDIPQTWNIVQEAQKKIKEKYDEFSSLLLWWKNEAFRVLCSIRTLEKTYGDVGIPLEPIKTVDDIITKEMRDVFIQEYLQNTWNFDKLDFIYKLSMPTPEEQYMFFKAHCLNIADSSMENWELIEKFQTRFGYVLTREKAWDLFVAIAEKTKSSFGTVYRLSHDFSQQFWYVSINRDVAEILSSRRGNLYRNGESVSHQELESIISKEQTIYFYYQHSYYGTLFLGNRVLVKENTSWRIILWR